MQPGKRTSYEILKKVIAVRKGQKDISSSTFLSCLRGRVEGE